MTAVSDPARVVPLEGGRNFRDLGGYPTGDGRRVRWGRLFRSGSLARLTQRDWDHLVGRGVRTICDLRTPAERTAEPFAWAATNGLTYWSRDYQTSFGELRRVMASDFPTEAAARAGMMAGFRELPFEQAPAYRQLFAYLKAGEVPLVVNCSAGKDRAGTAAAMILSALGVPRDLVVEDFLLTNSAVDLMAVLLGRTGSDSIMGRQPVGVARAILHAHPDYIGAALESVEERHGSVESYLHDVLDVSARELDAIRSSLLE